MTTNAAVKQKSSMGIYMDVEKCTSASVYWVLKRKVCEVKQMYAWWLKAK